MMYLADAVRQDYSKGRICTVDINVVMLASTAAGRVYVEEPAMAFGTAKTSVSGAKQMPRF